MLLPAAAETVLIELLRLLGADDTNFIVLSAMFTCRVADWMNV